MQAGPGWITGQYQAGQPGCVILMPYSVRVESVDQPLAVRAAMSQPQLHRGRAAMAPPPGVLAAQSRCWETSSSFPHPVTGRLDRGAPGVNPLYRAKVAEDLLQHGQTSGAKTTHDRAARAGGS